MDMCVSQSLTRPNFKQFKSLKFGDKLFALNTICRLTDFEALKYMVG